MENTIKIITGIAGAAATYLFGGWNLVIQTLMFLMMIDYITGAAVAAYLGELNSKIGFKGIAKKILIISLVAVAHLLDQLIISGDNQLLRDMVIFFYIANELISILENISKTNLPIPEQLKAMVAVLKRKGSE